MLHKKTKLALGLAAAALSQGALAADCNGVSEYPNWTQSDWKGDPSHAATGDLMQYGGSLYAAKWWTQSAPGSDGSCFYRTQDAVNDGAVLTLKKTRKKPCKLQQPRK